MDHCPARENGLTLTVALALSVVTQQDHLALNAADAEGIGQETLGNPVAGLLGPAVHAESLPRAAVNAEGPQSRTGLVVDAESLLAIVHAGQAIAGAAPRAQVGLHQDRGLRVVRTGPEAVHGEPGGRRRLRPDAMLLPAACFLDGRGLGHRRARAETEIARAPLAVAALQKATQALT